MAVNSDKPTRWKADVALSVDYYNTWFMQFAPKAYRDTRAQATKHVESALRQTANLSSVTPDVLRRYPTVLPILRMATAPPIARDRLMGLAGVSRSLIHSMEVDRRVPPLMKPGVLNADLDKVGQIILCLLDKDILPWLDGRRKPRRAELHRAATIVADRLCGAEADPIIRNAQEQRQLVAIRRWLESRGYSYLKSGQGLRFDRMKPGTVAFRLNIPVKQAGRARPVNIPVDAAIMPKRLRRSELPLLVEAKSAGDFTNTNKRRKEEATKIAQLRATYGKRIRYVLFLCGYFDSGYLGYEAAEGIDWVWEHRVDDLALFGL